MKIISRIRTSYSYINKVEVQQNKKPQRQDQEQQDEEEIKEEEVLQVSSLPILYREEH